MEHGNFETLRKAGGYIQSLDIMTKGKDKDATQTQRPDAETELEKQTSRVVAESENLGQTSDLAVWKYYISSLGWLRIAMFGFYLALDNGFAVFSCKHQVFGCASEFIQN